MFYCICIFIIYFIYFIPIQILSLRAPDARNDREALEATLFLAAYSITRNHFEIAEAHCEALIEAGGVFRDRGRGLLLDLRAQQRLVEGGGEEGNDNEGEENDHVNPGFGGYSSPERTRGSNKSGKTQGGFVVFGDDGVGSPTRGFPQKRGG